MAHTHTHYLHALTLNINISMYQRLSTKLRFLLSLTIILCILVFRVGALTQHEPSNGEIQRKSQTKITRHFCKCSYFNKL